jgi:hypothetical protein
VTDTGIFRLGHQVWQRAQITAAASYLREVLAREPDNARVKALYEGLLEVLDPHRRVLRMQRELAEAGAKLPMRERRRTERRSGVDRRQKHMDVPEELDRRSKSERRAGDRRKP